MLTAVEREMAVWEWREHLARRPATDLGVDAAALITEERAVRTKQIGSWSADDPAGGGRSRPGSAGIDPG